MLHQGAAQRARSGRPWCLFGNCPNDGSHGNCFHISLPDTFRPHGSGDGFGSPLGSGPWAALSTAPAPRPHWAGLWVGRPPPCPRSAPEPGQLPAHRSAGHADTRTRAIPLTPSGGPRALARGCGRVKNQAWRPACGSPALACGRRRGPSRVGSGSQCGPDRLCPGPQPCQPPRWPLHPTPPWPPPTPPGRPLAASRQAGATCWSCHVACRTGDQSRTRCRGGPLTPGPEVDTAGRTRIATAQG